MKDLDVYKLIIFASIVLIPAAGVFAYWQHQRLGEAEAAMRTATKRNGLLEQIGLLSKEIDTIKSSTRKGASNTGYRQYFENRILQSVTGGGLRPTDLLIGNEEATVVRKPRSVDYSVKIDFKRDSKPLPLSREILYAILLNCEAYLKGVWKLRELEIVNVEAKGTNGKKPPPKTVADNWIVSKMLFARREPDTSTRKKRR